MNAHLSTVVVIPTYDAAFHLERSLQSCINQTIVPEVWVVDNCSTDATIAIARQFAHINTNIKVLSNERNLGRIGNWNRCLDLFEESRFEFIKFLFAGDEMLADCIETIERIRLSSSDLAAISWPYIFRDLEGNETLSPMESSEDRTYSKEDLLNEGFYPGDFLGAIVSNAFSKIGVKNNRFDDYLIGIVPFYDRLVVKGSVYYITKPLSRFNLDSHRTFQRALKWDIVLESAFAKARSLELNNEWICTTKLNLIKERILARMLNDLVHHFSFKTWIKQLAFMLVVVFKSRLVVLLRILKRKLKSII